MRRSFWGESKKVEGRGRGKKGMLARKPLDFEKKNPVAHERGS